MVSKSAAAPKKKTNKKQLDDIPLATTTAPPATSPVNVILHLKVSLRDLEKHKRELKALMPVQTATTYSPDIPLFDEVKAYENQSPFSNLETHAFMNEDGSREEQKCPLCGGGGGGAGAATQNSSNVPAATEPAQPAREELAEKLKQLKLGLFKNSFIDKQCACFWCTYDYNTPAVYIPKYEMDNTVHAYGSFCSPECAAAFLMNEQIDDSIKFERYHLMNQIYRPLYGYQHNIPIALKPYYVLDKFFGNMSIEEYRAMSRTAKKFLILDKPMSRILPELHEDRDDGGSVFTGTSNYRVTLADDAEPKRLPRKFGL